MDCICCGQKNSLKPWMQFPQVPRTGRFYQSEFESPESIALAFGYCPSCGLVAQLPRSQSLEAQSINYVDVERATGHQLPSYSKKILSQIRQALRSEQDLILEIGANDGTFMIELQRQGCTNVIGVEPSAKCAAQAEQKSLKIIRDYFNKDTALHVREEFGKAEVIVCRHTLEHVPHPVQFLEAMTEVLSPDGLLAIEVPDSHHIFEEMRAHELWDEHLWYFSNSNFEQILARAGFTVLQMTRESHLSSGNLLAFAKKTKRPQPARLNTNLIQTIETLPARWHAYCDQLGAKLSRLHRPLFAIGASHPQQNFLVYSGLGQFIEGLIDGNSAKKGKFVPVPQLKKIWLPEDLKSLEGHYALLHTAFGYDNWMAELTRELADPTQILKPYCVAAT